MSAAPERFPRGVREAMESAGAAVTCLPVKLDTDAWEAAIFLHLGGAECKADRRALAHADGPVPVGVEADLLENAHAAVVVLRLEAHIVAQDPLAGEVLMLPGSSTAQFETLKLLSTQTRLTWFFAGSDWGIIHRQQHPLGDAERTSFDDLLRDAVRHDTVVRMTTGYDARAALSEIVSHYELRSGVVRADRLPPPAQAMLGAGTLGRRRN